METHKTAIVVLNWNGKKWLEKFLPNLSTNSKEATIYIADNASTDDSLKFIRDNFPNIRTIEHKENYGYAKGYNEALKKIKADYFVLINSDIEVTRDWIYPIINLFKKEDNLAACQPKILDYKKRTDFEYAGASGGYIDALGYPFCRGRIFNHIEQDEGQYEDSVEVFWATGACLFVRGKYFSEVGGLDEDFFAHQEEIDLCWRLKNKGYKIMVEPKSVVYHVGGGTLQTASSYKTYLNFRNNLSMLLKNLSIFELIWILPLRLILDGIAALSFLKKENGIDHLSAVAKGHISFYFMIPKLIQKRLKINQSFNLKGKFSFSILVKYYLGNYKKFTDL